jgi:ABC-type uncharacterized transport system permease subunit
MTTALISLALLAVVLPVVGHFRARHAKLEQVGWTGHPAWVSIAVVSMVASLVSAGVEQARMPMVTIRGGLLTVALVVSGGWMLLRRRPRMESAQPILLGLVVVLLSASLIEPPSPQSPDLGSPWFVLHFLLIFLGYGGMALSFAVSALFLVVRRRLKSKQLAQIARMPSLDVLDLLNFRSQSLGFVALTAGIAMGLALALSGPGVRGVGDLTVWGSLAVWMWYAAGLHARLVLGWRGRTGAVFGLVGFGGLGLILSIASLLLGGWHGAPI